MDGSTVLTTAPVRPNRTHGYGCGPDFVACLNDGEYHEYSDGLEQEANARLIAAAPDLLEALQDSQAELQRIAEFFIGARPWSNRIDPLLKANAAAIAKATTASETGSVGIGAADAPKASTPTEATEPRLPTTGAGS